MSFLVSVSRDFELGKFGSQEASVPHGANFSLGANYRVMPAADCFQCFVPSIILILRSLLHN